MVDKEQSISGNKGSNRLGESDDLESPVAPPSVPLRRTSASKHSAPSTTVASSSWGISREEAPAASEQPAAPESANEKIADSTEGPAVLQGAEPIGRSAPWSLVVVLIFLTLGMSFYIVTKSDNAPQSFTSVAPSPGIDETELASLQAENNELQRNTAMLEKRNSELEQRLTAEREEANANSAALIREKKTLERSGSDLLAQVDQLKGQIQNTAQKERPPAAPAPSEPAVPEAPLATHAPAVQNNGMRFRVAGLINGDLLNVRSGPGAGYSIVARLKNGCEISGSGDAV